MSLAFSKSGHILSIEEILRRLPADDELCSASRQAKNAPQDDTFEYFYDRTELYVASLITRPPSAAFRAGLRL